MTVWPSFDAARWTPAKRTFHACAQLLGKLRVALSPAQPNWMFTALQLGARGMTTGAIPWRGTLLEASIDVFSSELILARSTGETRRIALVPARPIAELFAEFRADLEALGVHCAISPLPQEVPDTTPFDQDHRPSVYDPPAVQRWFQTVSATAGIFDDWRSHFFGRTGIAVWWGALDLSLVLFNGKRVARRDETNYLLKYDHNAELMAAGLFYGDDATPPFFYGYIFPQPANAEKLPIAPPGASWSAAFNEWVLPYEAVRNTADPGVTLRAFLDSLYENCLTAAGWNRAALSYEAPKRALPR